MRPVRTLALVAVFPFVAASAGAQRGPGNGPGPGAGGGRARMEQQMRRNLWQIAKQRIGFTDAQMTQLARTSGQFDERRRVFAQEERGQRQILREELVADAKADQDRVAKALDRLHQLQRQRVDLLIEEQREFATFMTPVQRAKYAAIQEQVRRQVDSLRRARPDSASGSPR